MKWGSVRANEPASPVATPQPSARNLQLPRRLVTLYLGLVLYGVSMDLMITSRLGLDPWDVFHQGVASRTGLRFGWVVNAVGVAVLLLWIPLRQRPGFGTVSNVIVIGFVVNVALAVTPHLSELPLRAFFMAAGIIANAIATALYIGAGFGAGPRDGLMTGIARRGHSVRVVRTGIELTVLLTGWILGGTVGVGTVLYAVGIGPLVHFFLPRLSVSPPAPDRDVEAA